MGIYQNWILPRLLDLAMRNRALDRYRRSTVEAARGLVLEVGVGSGLNLPLYGPVVDRVCAIDPSPELLERARVRAAAAFVPVSLLQALAEQLPFAEAVFDTVVMTWTPVLNRESVCSACRNAAGFEGRGVLLFVEHGLSPEPRIEWWQHRLTPFWKRIGGGCHLDRKADDLIRAAGFRLNAVETGYMNGPKAWTFIYQGSATS